MKDKGLILALDTNNKADVEYLVRELRTEIAYYKVGLELFTTFGPEIVRWLKEEGCRVFADLKLHDIPNTVAQAAVSLTRQQVDMLNLHLSGGEVMVRTAVQAVREAAAAAGRKPPLMLGVTVLTSTAPEHFAAMGYGEPLPDRVRRLAQMGKDCGLDGVVASPREAELVRKQCGADFLIVTPGVRPQWAAKDDQQRITTPAQAMQLGADYLVVGRPITKAEAPAEEARRILAEMEGV